VEQENSEGVGWEENEDEDSDGAGQEQHRDLEGVGQEHHEDLWTMREGRVIGLLQAQHPDATSSRGATWSPLL
jgi:hypothetical protein